MADVDPAMRAAAAPSGPGGPTSRTTRARLMRWVLPERDILVAVIAYAVLIGVLNLMMPLTVQSLVNSIAVGGVLQPVVVLSLMLLIALIFLGVLRVAEAYMIELLQRRLFVRLSATLAQRLPRVSYEAYSRYDLGALLHHFFEIVTVQKASSTLLLDTMSLALGTTLGLLVLAFYHPILLAFALVMVTLLLLIFFGLGRGAGRTSVDESNAKYAVAAWFKQIMSSPASFRGGQALTAARRRADLLTVNYVDARRGHFRIVLRQIVGLGALHALAGAGLMALGGWLVLDGQLSVGQLVAAELIVASVISQFAKFGKHLETIYDLHAALYKLDNLIDLPVERAYGEPSPARDGAAEIVLDAVIVKGSPAGEPLSLTLAPGNLVALSGEELVRGSALLDLLYGLSPLASGSALINGVPLQDIALPSLREHIYLMRELVVFSGSVLDNLRLDAPTASTSQARAALASVGLDGVIAKLPEGLHAKLDVNGAPLTTEQLWLLQFARAILAKPGLLLVDNVLAQLSLSGRARATAALRELSSKSTILVHAADVTHVSKPTRCITLSADGAQEQA